MVETVIQESAFLVMVVSMVLGLGVMFLMLLAAIERVCNGENTMVTTIILSINTVLAWFRLELVRSTWIRDGQATEED